MDESKTRCHVLFNFIGPMTMKHAPPIQAHGSVPGNACENKQNDSFCEKENKKKSPAGVQCCEARIFGNVSVGAGQGRIRGNRMNI